MGETVYAAAKGGLIAFTKSLAREMARYTINVNCVCPGPTDTPLFQRQPERMREALTRAIPFRRIAQPIEIAQAVLFFLERTIGLHHRPNVERQRRADNGRLTRREGATMPSYAAKNTGRGADAGGLAGTALGADHADRTTRQPRRT